MAFPWKTLLGALIEHGPSVVNRVKQVMTDRKHQQQLETEAEKIRNLEMRMINLESESAWQKTQTEDLVRAVTSLRKIVQWLFFTVIILVGMIASWIVFITYRS